MTPLEQFFKEQHDDFISIYPEFKSRVDNILAKLVQFISDHEKEYNMWLSLDIKKKHLYLKQGYGLPWAYYPVLKGKKKDIEHAIKTTKDAKILYKILFK